MTRYTGPKLAHCPGCDRVVTLLPDGRATPHFLAAKGGGPLCPESGGQLRQPAGVVVEPPHIRIERQDQARLRRAAARAARRPWWWPPWWAGRR